MTISRINSKAAAAAIIGLSAGPEAPGLGAGEAQRFGGLRGAGSRSPRNLKDAEKV